MKRLENLGFVCVNSRVLIVVPSLPGIYCRNSNIGLLILGFFYYEEEVECRIGTSFIYIIVYKQR